MLFPTLVASFLAILATSARGAPSPAGVQQAAPVAGPVDLPMELIASRPLVRIKVNGQGPFAFLMNPEAPKTVLDARLEEVLKLAPETGDAPAERHVDLDLGSSRVARVLVEVGDTNRLVPEFGPTAQPRGVLSLATWADQLVTIDYARWRVRIEPGALPEPNDRDVFALRDSPRLLFVPLSIGDRTLLCHVDPIFPGGLLLPAANLAQFSLADKPLDAGTVNIRSVPVSVRQARLASDVALGSFVFETPLVLFGGVGDVATLGGQWLTAFSITYDITHSRARLDRQRLP